MRESRRWFSWCFPYIWHETTVGRCFGWQKSHSKRFALSKEPIESANGAGQQSQWSAWFQLSSRIAKKSEIYTRIFIALNLIKKITTRSSAFHFSLDRMYMILKNWLVILVMKEFKIFINFYIHARRRKKLKRTMMNNSFLNVYKRVMHWKKKTFYQF